MRHFDVGFPKGMEDTFTAMNAAYAEFWAGLLGEPRFTTPYTALGYGEIAGKLLAVLDEVPEDATADRSLIERWADLLGLSGAFHFDPQSVLNSRMATPLDGNLSRLFESAPLTEGRPFCVAVR